MVVAIVMGVWVASENRAGRIELDHYNGRYIQNMVGNCRQRLGDLREVAEGIAEQLRIAGVISPPPE